MEQEADDELDLSDIEGLDQQVIAQIQQKTRDKAVLNRKHAKHALHTYDGLFHSMYRFLANLANITSDSLGIYLRLYSVTDFNQWRLVKTKMTSIFNPNLRWAVSSIPPIADWPVNFP